MSDKTCGTCKHFVLESHLIGNCPKAVGYDRCTMNYKADHECHIGEYTERLRALRVEV